MIYLTPSDRITHNPWQTRPINPEHVANLAVSIEAQGLLQPPVARVITGPANSPTCHDPEEYGGIKGLLQDEPDAVIELALGHHRFEAVKLLQAQGKTNGHINLDIRKLTNSEMAIIAWTENEARKDTSPIERAQAIQRRIEDFGWTQQQAADYLGLARPTVANILRLLKLPQEIQAALSRGDISERVAQALLPIYQLPEDVLQRVEKEYYFKPSYLMILAMRGESSATIRNYVDGLIQNYTVKLDQARFGMDEQFTEGNTPNNLVYCATCRPCDRRLKHDGNICLDKECYDAKTAVWQQRYLMHASDACGIRPVDPAKGGNTTSLYGAAGKAIISSQKRCENLRIEYSEASGGHDHVTGWPHARIVCDKRNESCACQKALPYTSDIPDEIDPQKLAEKAKADRQAARDLPGHIKTLRERVKQQAEQWIVDWEPGAMLCVLNRSSYVSMKESFQLDDIRRRMATIIAETLVYDQATDKETLYRVTCHRLAEYHLPPISETPTLMEVFAREQQDLIIP